MRQGRSVPWDTTVLGVTHPPFHVRLLLEVHVSWGVTVLPETYVRKGWCVLVETALWKSVLLNQETTALRDAPLRAVFPVQAESTALDWMRSHWYAAPTPGLHVLVVTTPKLGAHALLGTIAAVATRHQKSVL